jgi:hypothetical protein
MTYTAMLNEYYALTSDITILSFPNNGMLQNLIEERQRLLTSLVAAGIIDNS